MRRLEDLADHPLFVRARQRLVPAVTQFLPANEQLFAALREPAFEGEVRFGAPYDIIGSYAPPILRRFSQALPNIQVTLVCKDTVVLLATWSLYARRWRPISQWRPARPLDPREP